MLVSGVTLAFALGASACDRSRVDPGETQTRSGELGEAPGGTKPRPEGEVAIDRNDGGHVVRHRDDGGSEELDAGAAREARPASDPRFDAARLSIVGTAKERELNLGLVRDPTIGSPVEVTAPSLQRGAGAVPAAPPPPKREGAGRPGAAADRYQ